MIFKQWKQVLDGTKTQTRRPVKEGDLITSAIEQLWYLNPVSGLGSMVQEKSWWVATVVLRYKYEPYRIKWQVGRTYAVQPGRGKKAVGRIRITKIRRERLQDIKPHEFKLEGMPTGAIAEVLWWSKLWDSIYHKPYRWEDNPEVWVLEFELAEAA